MAIKELKELGLITTKQRYLKDSDKVSLEYALKSLKNGYSFLTILKEHS